MRTLTLLILATGAALADPAPLRLHPDNPRYLEFRGRPALLIGSGEHYGAVLNADFDFMKYLDELARHGLTHTRTFTGAYVEHPTAFNISANTLAPGPGRLLCPWARSDQPGYAGGGNRFDLDRWDEAYFRRLRDFVDQAGRRGVVVELDLFCPFYRDEMWALSPLHASNNINGLGTVARTNVFTLDRHGGLLAVQERMVERIVRTLNPCDNLYYEICNEPYIVGVPMDWQLHIAAWIRRIEAELPHRHLISLNSANKRKRVEQPLPGVDIYNFHYAAPPDVVALNAHLQRPIGDNETGFQGQADRTYRREAWQFLLAGGALFSHLDYSFAIGHEAGTYTYPTNQPGGGGPAFRAQMGTLSRFLHRLDVVHMTPAPAGACTADDPKAVVYALAEPGRQLAAYLHGGAAKTLTCNLPAGTYEVTWTEPVTGAATKRDPIIHPGGACALACPGYRDDVAVHVIGLRP